MILDSTALSQLPRNTKVFVYVGFFDDPTTLSAEGFGLFLGYDASRQEVTYRPIVATMPGESDSIRSQITHSVSGLLLPPGVTAGSAGDADYYGAEEHVRLDEGHTFLDGARYASYLADKARQPGNDRY